MPSSKLSAYCDKIIEMGWLAAVIGAPLFFNVYSSRVFEPDKLTLVRSIAVLMSVAWLVKWVEGLMQSPRPRSGLTWRTPLVIPTLILVGSYLISTFFSITPETSLWGSYQRLQGTYTTFSYIVIFFMILQGLRDRRQVDRLVLTIIITSLPIAFYGLVQRYKLDPLPWGGDVTSRVASNMGNAIFVAAYLIMAFFLTLGRIIASFRAILSEEEAYLSDILRAAVYVFIAAVQFITVIFAVSRGPLIGWLAGVFMFGLFLLVDLRRQAGDETQAHQWTWYVKKWLWLGWIGTAALAMATLVIFNLPNSPLAPLRENPIIGRLGRIFETETGTGKVRVLIWEGAARLVGRHEPLEFPDGSPDRFNVIRPLVGYGPESMYVAYNRFYQPDLAHVEQRNASPDRSHNETFDALVITGLIGFLAEQLVFISIFIYGFHWIGMMPGRREGYLFIALWVGLGAVGALAAVAWEGVKMIGVGVPVGIAIGIVVYLVVYTLFLYDPSKDTRPRSPYQFLIISLLAAILAHYVEIHFGIAIASTRTTFWTFAGLLVVTGTGLVCVPESIRLKAEAAPAASEERAPATIPQHKKRRRPRPSSMERTMPAGKPFLPEWAGSIGGYAFIGVMILSTLFYEFTTNSERLADPVAIIWRALTTIPAKGYSTSLAILGMFFLVWVLSGLLIVAELARTRILRTSDDVISAALIYYLVSIGVSILFALVLASQLGALTVRSQPLTIDDIVGIADQIANILTYYYGLVFLVILAGASLLRAEQRWSNIPYVRGVGTVFLASLALIIALFLIGQTNMNPIKADIIYKQGDSYDKQAQWDISIAHYKRAIQLAPREDFYHLFLGRAFLEKARAAQNTNIHLLSEQTRADTVLKMNWQQTLQLSRQDLLLSARAILLRARELNPLNTDHSANLGRLYRTWADMATTPEEKQKYADQSIAYYRDATSLSPNNAVLWNEWATVYLYLKNDPVTAEQKLMRSLELDRQFNQTYVILGSLYMSQQKMDKAAEAYENALAITPGLVEARNALCYIYAQQARLDEAIACNQKLVEISPNDWNAFKNMAILFAQKGDFGEALRHAQIAYTLAPTTQQPALNAYMAQLEAQLKQPPPTITSTIHPTP